MIKRNGKPEKLRNKERESKWVINTKVVVVKSHQRLLILGMKQPHKKVKKQNMKVLSVVNMMIKLKTLASLRILNLMLSATREDLRDNLTINLVNDILTWEK